MADPVAAEDLGDSYNVLLADGSTLPVAKNGLDSDYAKTLDTLANKNASPGVNLSGGSPESLPQASAPNPLDQDESVSKFGNLPKSYATSNLEDPNASLSSKEKALNYFEAQKADQDAGQKEEEAANQSDAKRAQEIAQRTQALNGDQPSQAPSPTVTSDVTPKPTTGGNAQTPASPALDKIQGGFDLQKQAAKEGADVGIAKAAETAAYQKKIADEAAVYNQQQKEKYDQQDKSVQLEQQKYNDLAEKYRNTKISDPWEDMSTGSKIMAAISIGLGALGSPDGKSNVGMDIINKAIERDIQIQKANLEKQKSGVDLQGNTLNQVRSTFSDENQRDAALHGLYLEKVKNDLMAIASKYDAPQIQANLKQMLGQIENQREELKQKFTAGALDNFQKLQTIQYPTMTPEQAKNYSDSKKLNEASNAFLELQKAPSLLGKTFNTQSQSLVDQANAKAFEAKYDKPPSGKEFEDFVRNEGISYHDVGKPEVLKAKIANFQEAAQEKRLGAGRAGMMIQGK